MKGIFQACTFMLMAWNIFFLPSAVHLFKVINSLKIYLLLALCNFLLNREK